MAQNPTQPPASESTFEIDPEQDESTYELDLSDEQQQPAEDGTPKWYHPFVGSLDRATGAAFRGAAKAVGRGVIGLGEAVHQVPGVTRGVDALYGRHGISQRAMTDAIAQTQPVGVAEHIGYGAEQVAEMALPLPSKFARAPGLVSKAATAAGNLLPRAAKLAPQMAQEGARSAAQSYMQGGDPETAGALGAAAPVVGAVAGRYAAPVARAFSKKAEKRIHQALGATSQRYKAMAEKIVPDILRRRLGAGKSREALLEEAYENASRAGDAIDDALQKFGQQQLDPKSVISTLENAKNAFRQTRTLSVADALREGLIKPGKTKAGGGLRYALQPNQRMLPNGMLEHVVEFDTRPIRQLEGLKEVVGQLGPKPTVEQLVALRRAWDTIVDGAGGYAHRAPGGIGLPLKEQSEAWVKAKGAGAIRKLLSQEVPDLAAVNKEYHFWRQLHDVLTQTTQRTAPQQESLLGKIASTVGGIAGAAGGYSHGGGLEAVGGAYALAKATEMFHKVTTSPGWRFATGQMRDRLAKAIMANDISGIATALGRIASVRAGTAMADEGPRVGPGSSPDGRTVARSGRAGGPGPAAFEQIGDFEVREVP